MFWAFLIIIVMGITLVKVGALSVLVSVLAFGLKAAIGVIAALGLLMIWVQHGKH